MKELRCWRMNHILAVVVKVGTDKFSVPVEKLLTAAVENLNHKLYKIIPL